MYPHKYLELNELLVLPTKDIPLYFSTQEGWLHEFYIYGLQKGFGSGYGEQLVQGSYECTSFYFDRMIRDTVNGLHGEVAHLTVQGVLLFPQICAGKIGYLKYRTKPESDATTEMRIGRFFKRYGCNPDGTDLDDEQVKGITARLSQFQQSFELSFTKDRKRVSEVYQRGPSSCMSYEFEWLKVDGEHVHPSEVYCHPENNLELCYIQTTRGDIVARALLNTKTKQYTHIYAKSDAVAGIYDIMRDMLKELGYTRNESSDWSEGEKLLRLDTDCGGIICPYLDPGNTGVNLYDDYMTCYGIEEAEYSSGCLENYPPEGRNRCDYCEEPCSDTDVAMGSSNREYNICECCQSSDEFRWVECAENGHSLWVHVDNDYLHLTADGDYIYTGNGEADWVEINCGYRADRWARIDDTVTDVDGDVWHVDSIGDRITALDGEYYVHNDYVVVDGAILSDCYLPDNCIEIDGNHDSYEEDARAFRQYITEEEQDAIDEPEATERSAA